MKSVAGILKNFGVEVDFFVGLEVRGGSWDKDIDTGFLLFSVRGFVGGRGLAEE